MSSPTSGSPCHIGNSYRNLKVGETEEAGIKFGSYSLFRHLVLLPLPQHGFSSFHHLCNGPSVEAQGLTLDLAQWFLQSEYAVASMSRWDGSTMLHRRGPRNGEDSNKSK